MDQVAPHTIRCLLGEQKLCYWLQYLDSTSQYKLFITQYFLPIGSVVLKAVALNQLSNIALALLLLDSEGFW